MKNKIYDSQHVKGKTIVKKLNDVLHNKIDFKALLKFSNILSGVVENMEGFPEDLMKWSTIQFHS